MAGMSTFQSIPKMVRKGQPICFWPFGTLLGPSGAFWTISNEKWFFAQKHCRQTLLCPYGAKKLIFVWNGPRVSRWARKGPKLSKTSRFTISDPCGPLWTTLQCWQCLAMFVCFIGAFFETPCMYYQKFFFPPDAQFHFLLSWGISSRDTPHPSPEKHFIEQ